MLYNESELEDPQDIVEAFSRHFSSVYQDSASVNFVDSVCSNSLSFNITAINDEDILQSMKRLRNKMTAAHDQIPSLMVRDCRNVFVQPLNQALWCVIVEMYSCNP
ncbi:hypothetical protein QE152_g3984 [Popillia japonica]|uniref:Uncharacterized protein n=1 Tax=Popillia japonica TaxID=7064 RepID=A0AAW1MYP3_POPJA